jgi:N-acetylneuraminic acid mutarotase
MKFAENTNSKVEQHMNTQSIRSIIVLTVLTTLTSVEALAQSNWVRKTSMPTARSLVVAGVVEDKIYAIGGGPRNGPIYSSVEQYDPAADTWTQKAKVPTPRSGFDAAVANGKIYVMGGCEVLGPYLGVVEEYDPAADTWNTNRARMPTPRFFFTCGVVDGKIYAIGGGDASGAKLAVEAYDPVADAWTKKANMPSPRAGSSCSTLDGVAYVVGGYSAQGASALSSVLAYNPVTDTWTTKASMRTARAHLSTCVINGKIYAIGGCSGTPYDGSEVVSVEAYDPAANKWWRMPPMGVKRKALAAAAANGKVYAMGGVSVAGWEPALSTVEEYDPTPNVSILRAASTLKISWNGILESSDTLDGPDWQALNPTTWPNSISLTSAPMKFYRARTP